MAMALQMNGVIADPWSLTPRRIVQLHRMLESSLNSRLAIEANAMRMACAVGFNGDKDGAFDRFLEGLLKRPILRGRKPEDTQSVASVETDEEAEALALAQAAAIRNRHRNP